MRVSEGVFGFKAELLEDVVLGDEVASTGVEGAGEERGEDEVIKGV